MDIIITSNSPGELSAWVAPLAAAWRVQHPEWHLYLALVPCPFATGREADFAGRIEGLTAVWEPRQTIKILLGGRLPIPRSERGLVVYLGGDAWHAWRLAKRWNYPCAAYAVKYTWLWKYYDMIAAQRRELAERLAAKGVYTSHVGYIGWPARPTEPADSGQLCLGIFPGSRLMILRYSLGPFLELAKLVHRRLPQARFIMAVSPFVSRGDLQDVLRHPGECGMPRGTGRLEGDCLQIDGGPALELSWGDSRCAISRIDAAVAIPGTNTGEIAAAGKALIVGLSCNVPIPRGGLGWILEHLPWWKRFQQHQHWRYYRRQRFAAQPNRWAGEMIAPEIVVGDDLSGIVEEIVKTFGNREKRLALGERLAQIMGDPGAGTQKMADFIAEAETMQVKDISKYKADWQEFVFKWRGGLMAVAALPLLFLAHPTAESWQLGISAALTGELFRLWALGYSGEHTRSSETAAPELITAGPFALCRNPLYFGNAFNAVGVAAAAGGAWPWWGQLLMLAGCVLILLLVYGSCIAVEEKYLTEKFGSLYTEYCLRTPRFWPIVRSYSDKRVGRFSWSNLSFEKMTLLWWVLIWAYLYWRSL